MKVIITLTEKGPFWGCEPIYLTYENPDYIFPNWDLVDEKLKKRIEKAAGLGYIEINGVPQRESVKTPDVLPTTLTKDLLPQNLRVSEILPLIETCKDLSVLKEAFQNERLQRKRVKVLEALDRKIILISTGAK